MQNYQEVLSRAVRKGTRFTIGYDPEEEKPWEVTSRGNGHYFRSLEAVLAYCWGRGWITAGEFEILERYLSCKVTGADEGMSG